MTKTARERLARLLGDSMPAELFSAQLPASAHFLKLEVSGVGPVSLPVRAPLAKKLIAVARPAMFGRAEETLTDTSVRDTWELTPDQVTLGGPGWTALMKRALEHFRDELGLPPTSQLRAALHSMLVYGKGQFFLPHQDSEKDDAMVGTLVVSLPSAHTGGELVIDHAGQSNAYRASKDELTFVAFYADCRHQVTPVRSGYRERGPDALPVRVRGLHGQLRQHAGSVVSTGGGCRMAAGPGVRGARRGRIAVGAPPTPRPHRGRRPRWRTCRGRFARTVLEQGRGA